MHKMHLQLLTSPQQLQSPVDQAIGKAEVLLLIRLTGMPVVVRGGADGDGGRIDSLSNLAMPIWYS